jgi:hypothetical protein
LSLNTPEQVTIALAGILVVLVAMIAYRAWRARRISPEERERQRRAELVAYGKMGDATLVEIREDLVFYAYLVRGVEYTASQDVGRLKDNVPELSAVTAVSVKYDPRNPANSIIVAESWSGLHTASRS